MAEQVRFDDKMVLVELVADVPYKNDCRHYTTTEWHGKGDVQEYPERLVAKLLEHPDVWKLADRKPVPAPVPVPRAPVKTEDTELPHPALHANLTAEELDAESDEAVKELAELRGYGLHPRLNPVNLRVKFLEAQTVADEPKA